MFKLMRSKIILFILVFAVLLPSTAFAASVNAEQVRYIYFEDISSNVVAVDYIQAIEAALNGDSTLYDSILTNIGQAQANGKMIVMETDKGTVLDYQKALVENKTTLVQISNDINYSTTRPAFTQELKLVGGVAVEAPANVPAAPAVTNDDVLNTVSGMAAGMEYSLDGAAYTAYDQAAFGALNFSGNHTLLVRVAASGLSLAGLVSRLVFTVNPPPVGDLFEAQAKVNAEAAVAALESAPITTISQIATATGLKTIAESKVGLVWDTAAKAAFTARISSKWLEMAIAEINLQFYSSSMDQLFRKYAVILGLDLTDYDRLANKAPVQSAMLAPLFTTAAEIKTAFDSLVSQQKSVESPILDEINNASDNAAIAAAITAHASSLSMDLSIYNALTPSGKQNVQTALLSSTFGSTGEFKAAFVIAVLNNTSAANIEGYLKSNAKLLELEAISEFNTLSTRSHIINAVTAARPIADKTQLLVIAFNSTVNSGYIGQLLQVSGKFLGLDLTDYNSLVPRSQLKIQGAMLNADITSLADLQAAFNSSVSTQMAFEAAAVEAFNSAADVAAISAAITTYMDPYDLGFNYTRLANKVPVQEALLAPVFLTFKNVYTVFDAAVAAQK